MTSFSPQIGRDVTHADAINLNELKKSLMRVIPKAKFGTTMNFD